MRNIVLVTLMITSNAMVWRFFVKGLHEDATSSSLIPSIISTAANFLVSSLYGYFLLNESTNLTWAFGLMLVVIGLYFVLSDDSNNKIPKKLQ